ncbi:hypothetical protein [Streptomyces asiaticus]|uniref:hypothetical protein n=1 Tax=Streptomyces asiaticus TaxID=114695 RepID=UPI001BAC831F|nr:hypothetical protein [Streptomyces asiaticus]
MVTTRKFTREELETIGIPYEWDAEPGKAAEQLHEEQIDERRWVSLHEIVFRAPDDGKAYSVVYAQGLTENQEDTDPWEYEGATIKATEVEPHEVTLTVWRPAGSGS